MTCNVRPRRAEDLDTLADVLMRVHEHDGYPVEGVADPAGWLDHSHALASWTAVVNGVPVGQVSLTAASPEEDAARVWSEHTGGQISDLGIIARLFVSPEHRAVGAGRMLMTAGLHYAVGVGRSVALDVMVKDAAAIRLYERLGGRRIGLVEHSFGGSKTEPAFVFDFPGIDRQD